LTNTIFLRTLPKLSRVVLIAIPDRLIFSGAEVAAVNLAGVADGIAVAEDEAARAAIAATLAPVPVSTDAEGVGLETTDLLLALDFDLRGNRHQGKHYRGQTIYIS